MQNKKGSLYLIPSLLGESQPLTVLPLSVKAAIEKIDYYIVEHEKDARRFIKSIASHKKQSKLHFEQINKFTKEEEIPHMLNPCLRGLDMGVISDAGCPGIADPGARIIHLAHQQGIEVKPLVGPSSILLGMMSSGLNGQNFAFNGYLPIDNRERREALKQLEKLSKANDQTQLFIETPYRNNQMLESILSALHPMTQLCIACDLTLETQFIKTTSVSEWAKIKVDLQKRPTIFIIQAYY